jgi:hypothetical protein
LTDTDNQECDSWEDVHQAVIDDVPPIRTPAVGGAPEFAKVHADKGVRHEALCDRVG